MYKNINKIVSKSVAKFPKFRITLKDVLTFIRLEYKDALLIIRCDRYILMFVFSTGRRSRITDEIDWKERNCFCDPGMMYLLGI